MDTHLMQSELCGYSIVYMLTCKMYSRWIFGAYNL